MSTYCRATSTPWSRRTSTPHRRVLRRAAPAHEHRLGLEDRLAEHLEALRRAAWRRSRRRRRPRPRRRAARRSRRRRRGGRRPRRRRARAGGRRRARRSWWRRGGRARSAIAVDRAGPGGEPERRAAEAERHELLGGGAGVEQQVAAGDADVDRARADVHRDVAGAQEEELDVVVRVGQHELAGVAALAVAGLAEHLGGGAPTASPCSGRRRAAWWGPSGVVQGMTGTGAGAAGAPYRCA